VWVAEEESTGEQGLTVAAAVTALRQTSPETAAIVLTYFVQGVLGLSRLAVSFFLKDELHISPSMVRPARHLSSLFNPT
jgi:hypothetical protein